MFHGRPTAIVDEKQGRHYRMFFQCNVENWYSFYSKGKDELWRLHLVGIAQEFEQHGIATKIVIWCKGQRFDDNGNLITPKK
jgi:hypothetical protein